MRVYFQEEVVSDGGKEVTIEKYRVPIKSWCMNPEEGADVLHLRAMANRHRHSVYYIAKLSEKADKKINKLLDEEKPDEALEVLKREAEISFPTDAASAYESSWKLIPNKNLDPWKSMIARKR